MVVSSEPNPVEPVGSTVTLTCTVKLSKAVDYPVTVDTEWTGPDGFAVSNTAYAVQGDATTCASTVRVNSFGRDQSGEYLCRATVNSSSSFLIGSAQRSGRTRVTVGKHN